ASTPAGRLDAVGGTHCPLVGAIGRLRCGLASDWWKWQGRGRETADGCYHRQKHSRLSIKSCGPRTGSVSFCSEPERRARASLARRSGSEQNDTLLSITPLSGGSAVQFLVPTLPPPRAFHVVPRFLF